VSAVPAQPSDTFQRTFPWREWYAGVGRGALLWSVLHGGLVCLLLLLLGLFLGLLTDRGRLAVRLRGEEIERFEAVTGLAVRPAIDQPADALPEPEPAAPETEQGAKGADAGAVEPAVVEVQREFDDAGLLPSVWRSQDTWWGHGVAAAYRRLPALRRNSTALVTLLTAGVMLWLLRVAVLAHLRTTCRLAASEVAMRLRRHVHRQALRLGAEDIDGRGLEGAQTLFHDDAEAVRQRLFEWLLTITRYPCELAFLVAAAVSVEWLLTGQWALFGLLAWFVMERGERHAEHVRRLAEDRSRAELKSLTHGLAYARLVRGYGIEQFAHEQFQVHAQRYLAQIRLQDRVQDNPLWLRLVSSLIVGAIAAFLLFLLAAKVLVGDISWPGAGVFLTAVAVGLHAEVRLRSLPKLRQDVAVAADRIWRYLDQLPTVSQAVGARFLQPLSKTLHVERVTYRGPDQRVLLDKLDVTLPANRSYALLSLDPLEAKAFACLLPRLIEPQAGRILFDGEDIAWGTLESLRAETLYVSADDPLLPGTVLDNILAGRTNAALPQATEAAKEAHVHNFISRLPQGYETVLTGRDDPLDVGQRFRLSLARALLRNPSVMIIEEPAAALDEDTKQLLDDTYNRMCPGRTVFFLPRRLSTVRRCDDILFFHHGRIEAYGHHSLLVKESPLYRHWEYLHFNEFRHAP
jgi:ABC-type multidrug transport system fused ATPase/permease subunit